MNKTILILIFNEVDNIDCLLKKLQLKFKDLVSKNNFVEVIINRKNFGQFNSSFYALMKVKKNIEKERFNFDKEL